MDGPIRLTAFERLGKAYLAFARDDPAYYSAMFKSGVPLETYPALLVASERAFAVIRVAAEAARSQWRLLACRVRRR